MSAAPDIFLSYNREDAARAKHFAEAFAADGLEVWWDVALRSGEAYDEVTEAALRGARAVVVLWSPRSVVSRWCRAEATLAERNKTFLPVTIEPCERPIMFELTQTADLCGWSGDLADQAWRSFLGHVRDFVGKERLAPEAMPSLAKIASKSEPTAETLLAVLPFDNLSSDSEMEFFSDGVSDDILGRILRGSKIRVIGRTSSFQFRGSDKPKAAAALGASHVLDGSIRRAGTKVRIAAHLTDAASQTMLWSDKYDRDLEDIFAVQDEISEAIADALDAAFFPSQNRKIDPAIYDLYLHAKPLNPDPAGMSKSISLLEAVTSAAPDFADAWGRLAFFLAHRRTYLPYAQRTEITAAARSAIDKALALDPRQIDAKFAVTALVDPWGAFLEWDAANRELAECAGNDAHALAYSANLIQHCGFLQESIPLARKALALDPKEPMCYWELGICLALSGQFEEGRAVLTEGLRLAPDNHNIAGTLMWVCATTGDFETVDRLLDPARLEKYPLRDYGPKIIPFIEIMRMPKQEAARIVDERLKAQIAKRGSVSRRDIQMLAAISRIDEAYDGLDNVILGPTGGPDDDLGLGSYMTAPYFAPHLAGFRADPRFVKLCARLGLVEYWLARQKWPDCADEVPYDFRAECEKYRDFPKDVFFA
jgi:TolB-like protein